MGWVGSDTRVGSEAPAKPEVEAGPSKPSVPNVSSTNSGKLVKNAGLRPEAFQEGFRVELNAPSGTFTERGVSELPKTALILSPALGIFT